MCHVHVYMSVEMKRVNMEENLKFIIVFVLCFLKAYDEDICFLLNYIIIPYRTLNYKAQKFAMVLSSLDIHGIIGLRRTLVFFTHWDSCCIAQ